MAIYPNNDPSHPTGKLAVRQAIAYALDREQVAKIGEGGQQPAANQTGIVTPTFDKYFDSAALSASGYATPNVDKAKQALQSAGYSTSNPLKLSVITVTGYTDWDASLAVIKQQLAPIGIDLTVQDLAQQTYDNKLYTGDFDLAYYGESGGPTPYYELRKWLYSKNSAPLGKDASSNYERYNNPAVDALFNQYPTADDAGQVAIVKKIEAGDAQGRPGHPDDRVRRLVPVQHREHRWLADRAGPVRPAGRVQRARRRAGSAAHLLEVGLIARVVRPRAESMGMSRTGRR